jgi:hypothetical protein
MAVMMNEDVFARMVSEEVKNKLSSSQKKVLLQPENWSRWKDALLFLSQNLDRQIENIEEDAEVDAEKYSLMGLSGKKLAAEAAREYQYRIKKIDRFKFHVNRRLDEVMMMIETGNVESSDGWDRVAFLENAIVKHRELLREFDLEDTAVDRALWSSISGNWEFDSINEGNL